MITILIISYFLGAIPTGLIVSKYYNNDIRKSGSGNIGATNMLRVLGQKPAVITLAADIVKGVVAVMIAKTFDTQEIAQLLAGITVVAGHIYPVWLAFRGGKGIATSFGVFLMLSPLTALVALAVWVCVFYRTRISSAAAVTAIIVTPVFSLFINKLLMTIVIIIIAMLVLYKHKDNIKRLIDREEKRL